MAKKKRSFVAVLTEDYVDVPVRDLPLSSLPGGSRVKLTYVDRKGKPIKTQEIVTPKRQSLSKSIQRSKQPKKKKPTANPKRTINAYLKNL